MLVAPGLSVEDTMSPPASVLSSTLRPGATSMACANEPFHNTRTRCVGGMVPVANLTSAATNVGSEIIEKYSIAENSRKIQFLGVNRLGFQYFEWLKSCPSTHSTRRISLSVPEQPNPRLRFFTIRPYSCSPPNCTWSYPLDGAACLEPAQWTRTSRYRGGTYTGVSR